MNKKTLAQRIKKLETKASSWQGMAYVGKHAGAAVKQAQRVQRFAKELGEIEEVSDAVKEVYFDAVYGASLLLQLTADDLSIAATKYDKDQLVKMKPNSKLAGFVKRMGVTKR
jgi:hypothetical protein